MTPAPNVNDGSQAIRVALIDDEPLIRAGLRTILENDPRIRVVLEHGDGLGIVPAVRKAQCDVVLMDVRRPGPIGARCDRRPARGRGTCATGRVDDVRRH